MDSIFLFIVIILLASILQTSTGFGFSIMATPFLLLLFAPREAIQINLALSLVISSVLIMKIRHNVDTGNLKRFIIGSSAGLPIGILIFLLADMTKLKLGISIVILVLTILLIFQFRTQPSTFPSSYPCQKNTAEAVVQAFRHLWSSLPIYLL